MDWWSRNLVTCGFKYVSSHLKSRGYTDNQSEDHQQTWGYIYIKLSLVGGFRYVYFQRSTCDDHQWLIRQNFSRMFSESEAALFLAALSWFWVNYNALTTSSLEIMVSKGNHPQMAARFRLVNYNNLPRWFRKHGDGHMEFPYSLFHSLYVSHDQIQKPSGFLGGRCGAEVACCKAEIGPCWWSGTQVLDEVRDELSGRLSHCESIDRYPLVTLW